MADRTLPDVSVQIERLVDLGVPELAGTSATEFRGLGADLPDGPGVTLVVVHPSLVPPRLLVTVLERAGRPGFVVVDLEDLEQFADAPGIEVPHRPIYTAMDVQRGDDLRDLSPRDALLRILDRGRSPLTVNEGICWLLQDPSRLEPNHCFMTIGTRKARAAGLDPRTPALWISGGTGRDGRERRGAPKLGWCWAGNRHSWLGFASTSGRAPIR